MNNHSLQNKVCIVTGAGKGIGRSVAELFLENGAKLALFTRSQEDLKALRDDLSINDEHLLFQGDVGDENTVKEFVNDVTAKFGKIDILVNNAGMRFRKPFLDIATEEWNEVMRVNVNGAYFFTREVGKVFIKQEYGRVINIASIIGTLGLPDVTAYGTSKGAIVTMSKCLALEWAKHNINVNVIAPGFCETSYSESFKEKKDLYQFTLDRIPKKKWGSAQDVAQACLFLACDASNYITGEVLNVDGGWSAW